MGAGSIVPIPSLSRVFLFPCRVVFLSLLSIFHSLFRCYYPYGVVLLDLEVERYTLDIRAPLQKEEQKHRSVSHHVWRHGENGLWR